MDLTPIWQYLTSHHSAAAASGMDVVIYVIKNIISLIGTLVILIGAVSSVITYCKIKFSGDVTSGRMDQIRLNMGQSITLGLEFIVAADVIETTAAPDYYSVGILCIVVLVRTFLNYFLNKEILTLQNGYRSEGNVKNQ